MGNLKYASAPLSFRSQDFKNLQEQAAGCSPWLMASTHRGEEEMALTVHRALADKHPRLLTVIAPRHAARGDEIARLIEAAGFRYARRSKGGTINAETQVYLADTMGEMGLLYAWCPVVVMGGSFVRVGGHNPIEPAQLGAAIIFGPYSFNFSEILREFTAAHALVTLQHDNEIAFAVDRMLASPDERNRRAQAAKLLADQKRHVLDQIVVEMEPFLRARA